MENERNYIKEFRMKLTEAGITDPITKIELMQWLGAALYDQYQQGSDDAARLYIGKADKVKM